MASEKEEQWKMMDVGVEGREFPDGDWVYQNAKHCEKHRETAKTPENSKERRENYKESREIRMPKSTTMGVERAVYMHS